MFKVIWVDYNKYRINYWSYTSLYLLTAKRYTTIWQAPQCNISYDPMSGMRWKHPNHQSHFESNLWNSLFGRLEIILFSYSRRLKQTTNKSQIFSKILLNVSDQDSQLHLLLLRDSEVSGESPREGILSALTALTWKNFFLGHLASKRHLSRDETKGCRNRAIYQNETSGKRLFIFRKIK